MLTPFSPSLDCQVLYPYLCAATSPPHINILTEDWTRPLTPRRLTMASLVLSPTDSSVFLTLLTTGFLLKLYSPSIFLVSLLWFFLLSTPHSIPVSLAGFSSLVSSWGSFPKVPTRVPVSCFVASSCWLSFPPATVYKSVTPKLMSHSRSLLLAQDLDILFTVPLSAHTQCTNGISIWLVPPSHSSPLSPLASLLFISVQFCVSFLCLKCISFQY